MTAFKIAAEKIEYSEVLVSDGIPALVSFKKRNRRVVRAFTYDKKMDFTWTPDTVFINGPGGTEVVVVFTIL